MYVCVHACVCMCVSVSKKNYIAIVEMLQVIVKINYVAMGFKQGTTNIHLLY